MKNSKLKIIMRIIIWGYILVGSLISSILKANGIDISNYYYITSIIIAIIVGTFEITEAYKNKDNK